MLEFLSSNNVRIQQLQLLSHQSKIASTIEILTGVGDSGFEHATFQALGHLSMDNNERSGHRAQELKSVFIDASNIKWLKLKFHKCYINKYNLYNQVGLVAINALGEDGESIADSSTNGRNSNEGFQRTLPSTNPAHKMNEKLNDLAFDLAFDKATADKIRSINTAKAQCVKREDFQAAKALKNVENQMKAIGVQLSKMESQKKTACAREDYDAAKTLRDEISRLRDGVEARLMAIPAYIQFVNGGAAGNGGGGGGGGGGGDGRRGGGGGTGVVELPVFGGVPELGDGKGSLVMNDEGAKEFM